MNQLVAKHLREISTLYSIKGDRWRASAIGRAADCVEAFRDEITEENVQDIPGVGQSVAKTILEFQKRGNSVKMRELGKEIDPQCLSMLIVKGIGPKTAWKFYQEGVKNFEKLVKVWEKGELDERYDEAMRQAISRRGERAHRAAAQAMGQALLGAMKNRKGVKRISLAGSVRRQKETSKDLDLLISAKAAERQKLINAFCKLGKVISKGEMKASIWFELGENTMQADLLVIPDASFGAALQYFTGSREHNIQIRSMAQKLGYKANERGIYKEGRKVGGKNEEDIYNILGIEMPDPEDR